MKPGVTSHVVINVDNIIPFGGETFLHYFSLEFIVSILYLPVTARQRKMHLIGPRAGPLGALPTPAYRKGNSLFSGLPEEPQARSPQYTGPRFSHRQQAAGPRPRLQLAICAEPCCLAQQLLVRNIKQINSISPPRVPGGRLPTTWQAARLDTAFRPTCFHEPQGACYLQYNAHLDKEKMSWKLCRFRRRLQHDEARWRSARAALDPVKKRVSWLTPNVFLHYIVVLILS